MKHVVLTTLLLLIFGVTFVGCYAMPDLKIRREWVLEIPIEKYTGPQTVEGLMKAFDVRYSYYAAQAKWASSIETPYGEKRHLEFTLADMDAKYSREEWLQMLLNKGITIENSKTYDEYLNIRANLIFKEFHTTDDWETVKAKYTDPEIQKYQNQQVNPEVNDWVVLGENKFPVIPGRMYVLKTESGSRIWQMTRSTTQVEDGEILSVKGPELSEKQKSDLLSNGVEPTGWEIVYLDEKGNRIHQDK